MVVLEKRAEASNLVIHVRRHSWRTTLILPAAGRSVSYFEVSDSPLLHTVADLARERAGIRVTELAALLNLDTAVAAELARRVVSGCACDCFVCKSARIAGEPAQSAVVGSVSITFDTE